MAQERVERRLAAILAADMVGYSRLMEADEEGTIARQKGHRKELIDPRIAEYGGRLVKSTGDGVLVEFASAVDAVIGSVLAGPRTMEQWDEYLGALDHALIPEDEDFMDALVPIGHPSTPGYSDPQYPITGRPVARGEA